MVMSDTARPTKSLVEEVILRFLMSKITRITRELKRIDKIKMEAMDGFPAYSRIGVQLDEAFNDATSLASIAKKGGP